LAGARIELLRDTIEFSLFPCLPRLQPLCSIRSRPPLTEEDQPIDAVWDVTIAATSYARSIPNTNKRLEFEREAGALMKRAA